MTPSPDRPEDRAFAAYRRTGDPQHLGEVFDRVAGKLAILAVHLTRMPADAEDLVQVTFVEAIESAARWDERQPVLPWLTGILANLVKMRQRQAQQRVLVPERIARQTSEEPADAASLHEIAREVTQALDSLDETYRAVLVLRLLHGLRPVEIARALARPPETVRTQLHRGLRLLRERLPRSLGVTALAGILWPARGLAAVRAAVLARAGGGVSAAPALATGLGGLLVMSAKTWTLLVVGVIALVGIAGIAAWQVSAKPAPAPVEAAVPVDGIRGVASGALDQPSVQASSRRAAGVPTAVAADAPATRLAELRGRCVADESGTPLAGVRIELHGQAVDREKPTAPWTDPPVVVTGADGRFAVNFDPPGGHVFQARAVHDERVAMSARWSAWATAAQLDLGDVRMPAGVPVRGLVHEPDGTQRAGVVFSAQGAGPAFGSERGEAIYLSRRTSADGRFDLGRMPPGAVRLEFQPEVRVLSATEFVVRSEDAALTLDVVVAPFDPDAVLAGVVVDEAGRPMARVGLGAREARGSRRLGSTTTATDGSFTVACSAERGAEVLLEAEPSDTGLSLTRIEPPSDTRFKVGRRDLRLTIAAPAPTGTVRIQVVELGTLRPVERFAVRCLPDPTRRNPSSSRRTRLRLPGLHAGGVLEIDEVQDGAMLLVVCPEEPRLLPSGPITFLAPYTAALRVELRPRIAREIEVVRRDGRPVAGTRVELLHGWGEGPPASDTPAYSFARPFTTCCPKVQAFLLAADLTGETGRVQLDGPQDQTDLSVRIMGPGCVPAVVHPVSWAAEPLRCVVDTGATVDGHVDPPDFFVRMGRGMPRRSPGPGVLEGDANAIEGVRLRDAGDPRRSLPLNAHRYPVSADGAFRIDGIPPGTWTVEARWWTPSSPPGAARGSGSGPLATISLAEGQIARVDLDLRAVTPARLRGRILLDGEPVSRASWELHVIRSAFQRSDWVGGPETDAQGCFGSEALVPGVYRLRAYRGDQNWYDEAELTVPPGADVEHEFRLTSRRLRVRLETRDGKPVPGRTVRYAFMLGTACVSDLAVTDTAGVAIFAIAPPLPIELTTREPDASDAEFWKLSEAERARRTIALGTVAAPASGQREIEVKYRLPAQTSR